MRLLKFCLYIFMPIIAWCCNNALKVDKKYIELTDSDFQHKVDTVEGKTIYFKTATTAGPPQTFGSLNSSDKMFLGIYLKDADSLIKKHQPGLSINNITACTLDSLIDQRNMDTESFSCTENYFVNTVGAAFGQYLVNTYKMKWIVVSDEMGTDYATILDDIKLINYPLNSVQKIVEGKSEGSLETISLITKRQIEELRNRP